MKKKISDLFCLMKCGLSFKSQVAFGILFLILGSVWEVFPILGEVNMIDMGSVFLFCAVMFPTQMLISLDMSEMVQTSPYKKALQTSIPAKISACGGVLVLAWATLLKGIVYATGNISGNLGWQLLQIGIWMFLLMIFNGVCYKFFIISLIIMYILMFGLGMSAGMASFGKGGMMSGMVQIHPILAVVLDIGLILLGALAEYGIASLFYKFPLSKSAFGAAMKRNS